MDDLVTWFRAQLDEDERVAREAAHGSWEYQDMNSVGGGRVCDPTVAIATIHFDAERVDPRIRRTISEREAAATGTHIARWDPARVLAEVDAKRRILDLSTWDAEFPDSSGGYDSACEDVVKLLALPYVGRPGYRDEWRP